MSLGGWGLANPAGLWWCALALPIIALHILRPRRIQATVGAVFLWRKVARPVSAARPWQRLTPSWLLAAQVLAALLLGLAMAQPVRLTDEPLGDHTVFVIDASASMQANDGSPDRLATARERAVELRRQVPAGGEVSLVAAGAEARALLTRSNDADAFVSALATIEAADGPGDFAGAFALAAGLDTSDRDTQVVFLSDGGIEPADLRAAPIGTRYEPVGSSSTNRGLTQLSVEPATSGLLARVTVVHFGGPEVTQELRIDVDGVTVDRQELSLEPGEVANLAVEIPLGEKIEAFLEGEDAFALDNRAVATIARRGEADVLWVGPDDSFIAAALGASPGLNVTRAETVPAEIDPSIDVVVAAGVAVPAELDLPLLAIAPPGGARGIEPAGTAQNPFLTLIRSDHPLIGELDLANLFVAEAQQVTTPPGAVVLLGAEGVPLLISVERPSPTIYLAFDLDQSTLPLELAFPVLVDRALADLTDLVTPPARLTVGADLPIDPSREAVITNPEGTSETIPPGTSFPSADQIGFWTIAQPDRAEVLIAVGADRAESAIAPAPDLPFEEAFGQGSSPQGQGQIPWLVPVILVALAVLVAEYLLARRRRGVGPRQWRAATGLRVAVALALVVALIAPRFSLPANEVATLFLIDASDSMTPAGRAAAVDTVAEALELQPEDSRAGIVVFGHDARLETLVSQEPAFSEIEVVVDRTGTDLAAAVRLGAAALPDDARRRLVLISDGRPTTGDATHEADRLAADGIPLDVIVVEPPSGADLAVAGVDVPSVARQGERIDIDVRVAAPSATEAEVTLRREGETVDSRVVQLDAGENTLRFTDVAASDGVLRYQVEVDAVDDVVDANDLGYAAIPVEGADRVLVVAGRDGVADDLITMLQAGGLTVDEATPGSFPSIDELTRYSSIVLADVDRRDLSDGHVTALTGAVRDLGRGLVVLGGTHSYALGGYRDSDLEQILPVVSEITDPLRRQTVAEVLAIDSSGSMGACHCDENGENGLGGGNRVDGGVSKTAIARNAAARAIAALEATDEVGVLTMDASDRWVIDLQPSPSQDVIDEGLSQIVPNGPTFVDSGLLTAADELRQSEASLKHIIFFSDGFTEPSHLATMADQAAELLAEGITVSVVATGEGAAEDLRPIAEAGGGRYYPGRNLDQIPELIVQEAVLASRDFVNEGEFLPLITSNRAPVRDLTESPPLQGYIATTAKPTATVDLRIGPDQDPLLSSWQAGLGRVTAWTSDSGERWAAPWSQWSEGPEFWSGVIKDTFPVAGEGGGIQAHLDESQLTIRVDGADDWPQDATASVRVAGPDGSSTVVDLERIDGSSFGATVPVDEAGTYAIGAVVQDGDETAWSGVGLTTRSYPAEYAPAPVGHEHLTALADTTGGRVDPGPEELFASTGTTAGSRTIELARWMLLFAVLAWPIAVGLSRLAWRRGLLAVGTERAASTVSELRSRLPRLAEPDLGPRRATGDRSVPTRPDQASAPPGDPSEPGSSPPTVPTPEAPTPSGTPAAPTSPAAPASPASPPSPPASDPGSGDGPAPASTVSELLARKRRKG
jgi:Mg-chelatase subunit ChlD